ncbi:MAG: type II toxin-antitoxin system RelE/ParE family toxin [Brumimicrobium sp.]
MPDCRMGSNYSLSISEAAELDIRDAFLWYEDQKENLGLKFEKHFSKTIQNIRRNPLKIQIRYNQTRVAFLKKFPYGVHFNVFENEIIIIAVFHTSQSPQKWGNR